MSMHRIGICRILYYYRTSLNMSSRFSYEDAVSKLNLLQSNKATIEQIRKDLKIGHICTNLNDMENYLLRTGVTMSMLDQLSVIHVAGTKGKGSTSALCESILRAHGFCTGFYSSPHLVEVRERIRLCGRIISRRQFSEYFHQVYDALYNSQAFEGDMPKYFSFLTVLAFNIFLKEKVDVAIVEVGIGGIVDYTNVLRKVPVVGITALGLDHTTILGNTLPEIAAAKAGIMKPGCEAYTVHQPPEAMDVLRTVASNVKCPLYVVPDYDAYNFENEIKLSCLPLEAYKMNASLAIQLSHAWMCAARKNIRNIVQKQLNGNYQTNEYIEFNTVLSENDKVHNLVRTLSKETVQGLQECKWPGRYQIICTDYAQIYLDGAHTKESIEICTKWFIKNTRNRTKVLIFSATGDRDSEILLRPLKDIDFVTVFFVIPRARRDVTESNDNYSKMEHKELLNRCTKHAELWKNFNNKSEVIVLECVSDALLCIKNNYRDTSVLITGSLHLVGAALSIIDPNLSND